MARKSGHKFCDAEGDDIDWRWMTIMAVVYGGRNGDALKF
jgi:hypothetical protein